MVAKNQPKRHLRPPQTQRRQPGIEGNMHPQPESIRKDYRGSLKLEGRVALITGGDSGIGRAVALAFAHEGADVAIVYLNEHEDAKQTAEMINQEGHMICKRLALAEARQTL